LLAGVSSARATPTTAALAARAMKPRRDGWQEQPDRRDVSFNDAIFPPILVWAARGRPEFVRLP
jgi:hypothetical protein